VDRAANVTAGWNPGRDQARPDTAVIFGPDVIPEMHASNKSVPIADRLTATKTLAIVEWCGIA
jgi:hypothetical protein